MTDGGQHERVQRWPGPRTRTRPRRVGVRASEPVAERDSCHGARTHDPVTRGLDPGRDAQSGGVRADLRGRRLPRGRRLAVAAPF